jgi:hypothetical protein
VGLACLVLLSFILVITIVPSYIVGLDLGSTTNTPTAERLAELKNDVRTTLLQALAGIVLFAGAIATWRNIQINKAGQITERFTRAIEQLGSKQLQIRLGGIYALERIARDSSQDHGPVMGILTAFLRDPPSLELDPPFSSERQTSTSEMEKETIHLRDVTLRTDVQAALTVVARRKVSYDTKGRTLDLAGVVANRAMLENAHLENVSLMEAFHGGS